MTLKNFLPPPDTRVVNFGSPAPDMNAVVDWMTMTTGFSILNTSFSGGAFLDGVSNSTAAIQACMNAAAPFGAPVLIPAGVQFRVTQLTWNAGQVIQGVYCGTYPTNETSMTSTLVRVASSNLDLITVPDGTNTGRISDIQIDGNKNNNTSGDGFHIADGASGQESQIIIERCYFHDNPGSNIYLGHNRRANKVIAWVFNYAGVDGITSCGSDNLIRNNICGSNGRAGICLGTTITQNWAAAASPFAAAVEHVIDNDVYGNVVGIALAQSTSDCMVMGNGIDRNTKQGITVYDGDSNCIVCNSLHSNGTLTNNTYAHIDVGTNVAAVSISDNNFGPLDAGITNVASFCVNYGGSTNGTITGNIGVADATGNVGGLINSTANSRSFVAMSKAGAVIQGSGNDILDLNNTSGTLITKVTNGGTFVHTGGQFQLGGHFTGLAGAPGVANGTNCTGSAIGANSSDVGGTLSATMVASPAAGSLITVTFHTSFTNTPAVTLTPTNQFAAQIQTYVTVTNTGFTINQAVTPPAAVDSQAVSWDYSVIGQNA